ncbi:unnamed protein product, partial [Vitis vinifera]|uniref:Uncharacterized protein n=1 Tax=Vitis vinifera TaxID=29760 RepID=D7UD80_VITVI
MADVCVLITLFRTAKEELCYSPNRCHSSNRYENTHLDHCLKDLHERMIDKGQKKSSIKKTSLCPLGSFNRVSCSLLKCHRNPIIQSQRFRFLGWKS